MTCPVRDCPQPDSAAWHVCQVGVPHKCWGRVTHVHLPKKGMAAGRKESRIVGCACMAVHDAADNGLAYEGYRWYFGLTPTHWTVSAEGKEDHRIVAIPIGGRE